MHKVTHVYPVSEFLAATGPFEETASMVASIAVKSGVIGSARLRTAGHCSFHET